MSRLVIGVSSCTANAGPCDSIVTDVMTNELSGVGSSCGVLTDCRQAKIAATSLTAYSEVTTRMSADSSQRWNFFQNAISAAVED